MAGVCDIQVPCQLTSELASSWDLLIEHTDALRIYVRRRLSPYREPVEDLVQEVLLAAWQHLPQFTGRAPLRAWLFGIARHKVEDHYRACLRPMISLEDLFYEPDCASIPDWDRWLDQDQANRQISLVLSTLPPRYRQVLRWRYWEQRSAAEMSVLAGRTEKSVERLLARARSHFRRLWLGLPRHRQARAA